MEFVVRIEARLAGRVVKTCDVATIPRPGVVTGGEELGLSLEDGKEIVREMQSRMIAVQVEMLEGGEIPLHSLRASQRHQRSTPSSIQNGLWSGSRTLPPIYLLHLPRRQSQERMATAAPLEVEHHSRTSISAREVWKRRTIQKSGTIVDRIAAFAEWRRLAHHGSAPYAAGGRAI
jgi:hypothetical protein